MHATDLLSRLTGRVLKDDLSGPRYQEEGCDVGRHGVAAEIDTAATSGIPD
jgi:hypothetical protein